MKSEPVRADLAPSPVRAKWNSFELWLAILAVVSAINVLAGASVSVAFFGCVTAVIALLSRLGQSPLQFADYARHLFQNAAKFARGLLTIIAIGGTIGIFDYTYKNFNFLPEWCDVWVKRSAPGLIAATIVSVWGYKLSHRIQKLVNVDGVIRRYELPAYFSLLLLAASCFLLFMGAPVELILTTSQKELPQAATWPKPAAQMLRIILASSFIWAVAFSLMLSSRLHERHWKGGELEGSDRND